MNCTKPIDAEFPALPPSLLLSKHTCMQRRGLLPRVRGWTRRAEPGRTIPLVLSDLRALWTDSQPSTRVGRPDAVKANKAQLLIKSVIFIKQALRETLCPPNQFLCTFLTPKLFARRTAALANATAETVR